MAAATVRGRTAVSPRAYERIVAAAAADLLGLPAKDATARVRDERGRLSADVTAGIAAGEGEGILPRAARARDDLAARVAELTGADVSAIRLHLTHLITDERRIP